MPNLEELPQEESLAVEGLTVEYRSSAGRVVALHDVSFRLGAGKSLCLIGGSGAAKTTLLRAISSLLPAYAQVSGDVHLPAGGWLNSMGARLLRSYRRDHLGVVFQDAVGSLVPGTTVGLQLERAYRYRRQLSPEAARDFAIAALRRVGFARPEESWRKPPSALSGGMCQRVMIALALAAPKLCLLLADEPVSSLDAVSSAQVLELLLTIQREERVILLWVSHDARIARHFDWVGVLEEGALVEFRSSTDFFARQHTVQGRALLDASRSLGDS